MSERPTPQPVSPVVAARGGGGAAGRRPASSQDRAAAIIGGLVLAIVALLAAGLVALVALERTGNLPAAEATRAPGDYALADVRDAPPLELTDQDGQPFALASLRGRPVLLFFGYTHCPDVCPTTVGVVTEALAAAGDGPRAVFTSIDPERDDVAAMKSYLKYLSPAFIGLSGTPTEIRTAADAWGVHYAKIETGSAGGYAMAHTADLFLVDGQGRLRAKFPFGTDSAPVAAFLRKLLAETPVSSSAPATPLPTTAPQTPAASPTPGAASPTPAPGAWLIPMVVSSSVWAGGGSPVILKVSDAAGAALPDTVAIRARAVSLTDGTPAGPEATAVAVRPQGETSLYYVVSLDFPSAGTWRIDVTASTGETGSVPVSVLDPGATKRIGEPAPDVRTPTLADVGGDPLAVTTNPQPDLRLSQTSTADARAAGKPYVLVIDSARFKVSTACGRALTMIRYLLDRWPDVAFIHLEPFVYSIVTSEPALDGDIANPPLNSWTRAWGIGDATWTALDMPWVFVVDGSGIVRAKYTGIVGSADVDVIISLITGDGVVAGG
jgi:protein SCO1/2